MIFTGKLTDVSIDFNSRKPKLTFLADDTDSLNQVDEIKDIDKLSIEAKKYRNQRSIDANAYFHLLVNKLARYFSISDTEMKTKMNLEYGTVALNLDGTKVGIKVPKGTKIEKFYPYCKWFGECIEGDLCFDKYLIYKQTHTLDSKEMSQLINGVVQECKEVGIETLTDEELKSMMENYEKKENKNE